MSASIIVPLRASPQVFEWDVRLQRILSVIPADRFETIIVDLGSAPAFAARIGEIAAASGKARVVRVEASDRPFSIAEARNAGAVAARTDVILFHDIDFLAPEATYRALSDEIRSVRLADDHTQFFCVPVVFLTERATRSYLKVFPAGGEDSHRQVLSAAGSDPDSVAVSVAYGSSAMVANRRHCLSIGGHDESFSGHSAEDHEFLHRLFATIPKGPRPPCYQTDFRDNGIRRYRGFRAAFALYGLDAFAKGLALVHLAHPSRPIEGYFQRDRNVRLLEERMAAFDRRGRHPDPLGEAESDFYAPVNPSVAWPPETFALPRFVSFGGPAAIERASRIAALEDAVAREPGLSRRLFRMLAAQRLPRSWRPASRLVPRRLQDSWADVSERILLAWERRVRTTMHGGAGGGEDTESAGRSRW